MRLMFINDRTVGRSEYPKGGGNSEKATNFCEISTVDLSYVLTVKSMVEILQDFVAFSEYMNFNVVGMICPPG